MGEQAQEEVRGRKGVLEEGLGRALVSSYFSCGPPSKAGRQCAGGASRTTPSLPSQDLFYMCRDLAPGLCCG